MDNGKTRQPKMVKILSIEALEIIGARKEGVTMRFLVETAIIQFSKTELGKALIDTNKYSPPDIEDEEEEVIKEQHNVPNVSKMSETENTPQGIITETTDNNDNEDDGDYKFAAI